MARRSKALTVRRVRSIDDRNVSQFLTLPKTGESFTGYALFTPDPEVDDNPGYFEYFDHWDQKNSSYVPCAGPDVCPFCKVGDRPSTRAKTLWLVDDNVKIFTLNWSMINEFADMLSEDEQIQGESFRIKRLDDRGKYRISPKGGTMKTRELDKLLDGDNLPDLEDVVTSQLRRSLEDLDVASAMEDDDDDEPDEDEAPKARRGRKSSTKSKAKAEPEPEEDENEDLEEVEVTITSVSKAKETIKVEGDDLDDELVISMGENDPADFKRNMEIVISAEWDEDDEEYVLGEWTEAGAEPDDEEPSDEELPDEIEKEKFEIVNVDADEETLDVKSDEFEFTLYFLDEGDAADVDFDDYEEGDNVTISAVKDKEGDMVATAIPKKARGRRRATSRK